MKRRLTWDRAVFSAAGYTVLILVALLCLLPFIMILSGSFTAESKIVSSGFSLIPSQWSLEAYKTVFKNPTQILNGYMVTIFVTVVGTAFSLFLTAMTGYVLTKKELKTRNIFSFFFYFTTLFSGGLVPWYLLIHKYLGFSNNIFVLIVPYLLNVFYIIIMRSFMKSIPEALFESAKIDGAGEFRIFIRIALPLAGPALATIGLFIALVYWNDWYLGMLFIDNKSLYPLQLTLYNILNSIQFLKTITGNMSSTISTQLPTESLKLAMTVVATGPIVILYPFLQRFFVKGLTIGAVKG